jgi:hypothetical protein
MAGVFQGGSVTTEQIKETIKDNLYELLAETGKTQADILHDGRIPRDTVYRAFQAKVEISARAIVAFAEFFGVTTDRILRRKEANHVGARSKSRAENPVGARQKRDHAHAGKTKRGSRQDRDRGPGSRARLAARTTKRATVTS